MGAGAIEIPLPLLPILMMWAYWGIFRISSSKLVKSSYQIKRLHYRQSQDGQGSKGMPGKYGDHHGGQEDVENLSNRHAASVASAGRYWFP